MFTYHAWSSGLKPQHFIKTSVAAHTLIPVGDGGRRISEFLVTEQAQGQHRIHKDLSKKKKITRKGQNDGNTCTLPPYPFV